MVLNHNSSTSTRTINEHAFNFVLLLNVNDYQHSYLQIVGDHSAIIMGPVLSVYLCNFFIK